MPIDNIEKELKEIESICSIIDSEDDLIYFESLVLKLLNDFENYKKDLIYSSNIKSIFINLKPKAGGLEAENLVSSILKTYLLISENNGFNSEIVNIEYSENDDCYKQVSLKISGNKVYDFFKNEEGNHRFVRKSPYGNGKLHTSFVEVEIVPYLNTGQKEIKVNKSECRIDVFRASGAGGQHRNKTDSAVRLTHLPTNIVVLSTKSRSQLENRKVAFQLLESLLLKKEQEKLEQDKKNSFEGKNKNCWGNQIRSYYLEKSLIKDHRSNLSTHNVSDFFNGKCLSFFENNNEYIYVESLKK